MNFSVEGRNVTVVGAARSGVAAALLLASRGARVTLSESRPALGDHEAEASLRQSGVYLELGAHEPATFVNADLLVLSPGVPPSLPAIVAARSKGVPVIGEIELASRWLSGRIVAITGTKGKSTTTTLTGRMLTSGGLKALVGGNIGTPLSSQVPLSTPETFHVVEVSSFQLEGIETFHPWVAVLLNFSPDHLDRHAGVHEYAAAKSRIFENQTPADWAVINADDPQTLEMARNGRAQMYRFAARSSVPEGMVIQNGVISERRDGREIPLIPVSSVRLLGRHLLSDVLAAASVARLAGVSKDAMVQAVESFTGLEHALEPVARIGGVQFVNDSKATNVEAAKRAIETFDAPLVVIMGGRFKGGDLSMLEEPLGARKAAVVAIGEASDLIESTLGEVARVRRAGGMRDAVRMASELAQPAGTVLLAPACASFDMFRDYADRGSAFKREVRNLERGADDA